MIKHTQQFVGKSRHIAWMCLIILCGWRLKGQKKLLGELCLSVTMLTLTHFIPLVSFDTPWKFQKTTGFQMFSGSTESDEWHKMGYVVT